MSSRRLLLKCVVCFCFLAPLWAADERVTVPAERLRALSDALNSMVTDGKEGKDPSPFADIRVSFFEHRVVADKVAAFRAKFSFSQSESAQRRQGSSVQFDFYFDIEFSNDVLSVIVETSHLSDPDAPSSLNEAFRKLAAGSRELFTEKMKMPLTLFDHLFTSVSVGMELKENGGSKIRIEFSNARPHSVDFKLTTHPTRRLGAGELVDMLCEFRRLAVAAESTFLDCKDEAQLRKRSKAFERECAGGPIFDVAPRNVVDAMTALSNLDTLDNKRVWEREGRKLFANGLALLTASLLPTFDAIVHGQALECGLQVLTGGFTADIDYVI